MMGNKGKQLYLIIDNELKNLVAPFFPLIFFSEIPFFSAFNYPYIVCDIFQISDLSKKIFSKKKFFSKSFF